MTASTWRNLTVPFRLYLWSAANMLHYSSSLTGLIYIDRRRRSFHERQNCFCPANISKYQSPVGEVRAGLQIRAIKPQKASLIFLHENKEQKNIHQTTISLARDGAFVYSVMRPTSCRGAQKL